MPGSCSRSRSGTTASFDRILSIRQKFAQLGHACGESAVLGAKPDPTNIFVALEGTLGAITEAHTDLVARGYTNDNRVRKILYHFRQIGETEVCDEGSSQEGGVDEASQGKPGT